MAFCSSCGNNVEASTKFCAKCGTANPTFNVQATTTVTVQTNMTQPTPETKPWMTTFLLSWFLGAFGAHRFYVGKTGSAVGMLLTCGGCGIWTIVDVITLLTQKFTDKNGVILRKKKGDNKVVWIIVIIAAVVMVASFIIFGVLTAAAAVVAAGANSQ